MRLCGGGMYCTINCERASSLLFLKPDASRHPIHAARRGGRGGASAVAAYFDPLSLYFITPECGSVNFPASLGVVWPPCYPEVLSSSPAATVIWWTNYL